MRTTFLFICLFLAGTGTASLLAACGGNVVIARDADGGDFTVGSHCDPHAFPDCGNTDLDCDALTNTCVQSKTCTTDAECTNHFTCRKGVGSCAVACFASNDGYCEKGTHCDVGSARCVADTTTPASTTQRICPPTCYAGHECCAGSCAGPAVSIPSDCCSCLDGEVNSMTCSGGKCGG